MTPNLLVLPDTCNVYALRDGDRTHLVDFGSGTVLERLRAANFPDASDVLVTHHHRDQVQGLRSAVDAGIPIWVPPVEQNLVAGANEHWQARHISNSYNVRQDRFSLLNSVPIAGTVTEYRPMRFGELELTPIPTPGHTIGSVSYRAEIDGQRVAFTGDLLYAAGKVWSLAATMWSYGELQGVASTILSLLALREKRPELLLPSHGEPITDPIAAIDRTVTELRRLLEVRGSHLDLEDWLDRPYVELTPHLLHNRTSQAYGYVLKSHSGKALLFDYGYDFTTGLPAGTDRAGRRPWLYTIERLKREQGIDHIDVVIPTHYHDDHVAGINLLREVEGTEVWTPENFSDVIERPERYDLPCLWYEPVPVDRVLPIGGTVRWEEYEISIHELRGHTAYAAAYSFEADGTSVVISGDQQDFGWGRHPFPERLNYIYQNRVTLDDFVESAELYRRLAPELMAGGHWAPRWIAPDYLEMLATRGELFRELHRSLLPLDEVDLGLEGFAARIEPYRSEVAAGTSIELDVWVRNPFPEGGETRVELAVPPGWTAEPQVGSTTLEGRSETTVRFTLQTGSEAVRRARIAADVTIGARRLGQHAEALVTIR
ncbi:MAG: MBL fold metallo-hydrolase [Chloroflexi bacterium]|nr:MBL fold metallo-hydrolase [Chloroflexota bacterium]